uniref:myotubularin-related protein 14-like n=1 Tax=Styela clava TaxID=7725 RepID=UPI001939C213|nr:myotubularin-related protein 14-like [Styela clava]
MYLIYSLCNTSLVMADNESRLIPLLSFAISGSNENLPGNGDIDMLSKAYETCHELMERDYTCEVLNNPDGHLCSTYPEKIIIPVKSSEKVGKLSEYVLKGRFARTRGRFVVPVLLLDGKYICRSSTLARSPEIYCRQSYGYWVKGESMDMDTVEKGANEEKAVIEENHFDNGLYTNGVNNVSESHSNSQIIDDSPSEDGKSKEWLLDKMRNADIQLLRYLDVDTIFDLMVENKKVKFGMNVTSSEKVDRQRRYLHFNLLSVPYPGCEFFVEYRNHNYSGEGLMFDWKQDFVDANLHMPDNVQYLSNINWQEYINWDLVQLTQNYLKLHLHSLIGDNSTGILLHCISGWDRTPLFVSLVRLSLWADGLAHQSLNAEEMAYFTVAYDWLLFGHQFTSRIPSGEEIFYFCFDFLKYVSSEEYSMVTHCQKVTESLPVMNGNNHPTTNGNHEMKNHNCSNQTIQSQTFQSELPSMTNGSAEHEVSTEHRDATAIMNINDSCCWIPEKGKAVNWTANRSRNIENNVSDIEGNGTDTQTAVLYDTDDWRSCNSNGHDDQLSATSMLSSLSINECVNGEHCEFVVTEKVNNDTHSATMTVKCENVRKKKLEAVRDMVLKAYEEAMQWHREREQRNNSGLAAIFFNQISKTFSLVKR